MSEPGPAEARTTRPNAVLAGLASRCPNCGKGPLFQGFLKVRDRCRACGFDLKAADAGDGPAVFVMLIAPFPVVFLALWAEVTYHPPVWVHMAVFLPLMAVVCLALLRPFKGVLVALQFRNHASEVRNDDF